MKQVINAAIVLLLFSATLPARAQSNPKKEEKDEESLTVKFPKFPLANFPDNAIPVSGIRLMLHMSDSADLGYVLKGMSGRVVKLKTSKPLSIALQDHITRMYKDEYKKSGATMLWVIHALRLSEKTVGLKYIYTHLLADTYLSQADGLFRKLFSVDTVLVTESTDIFTRDHSMDIENVFRFLAKASFQKTTDTLASAVQGSTIAQITQERADNTSLPILTDPSYAEGGYANFAEFLQNKPSLSGFRIVRLEKNKIRLLKRDSNSSNDTINVWGICEKGIIYKYYDEYLTPLERTANGFGITGYVEAMNKINREFFYKRTSGAPIGGVAGALINAAMYKEALAGLMGKVLLIRSIPYISDPLQQPIASCIDMRTGAWFF